MNKYKMGENLVLRRNQQFGHTDKNFLDNFNYYTREYKPFTITKVHRGHSQEDCPLAKMNRINLSKIFDIVKVKRASESEKINSYSNQKKERIRERIREREREEERSCSSCNETQRENDESMSFDDDLNYNNDINIISSSDNKVDKYSENYYWRNNNNIITNDNKMFSSNSVYYYDNNINCKHNCNNNGESFNFENNYADNYNNLNNNLNINFNDNDKNNNENLKITYNFENSSNEMNMNGIQLTNLENFLANFQRLKEFNDKFIMWISQSAYNFENNEEVISSLFDFLSRL